MAPYPKIEVGKKSLTHLHKQPKSSKDLRVEPKSSLQLHQSQPPSSDRERPTTASNPNILPLSYLSSPSLAQAESKNGQPYLLSRNGVGRDWLGRSGLEGGLSSEKSAPPEVRSGVVSLSNRNLEKEIDGCETSRSRKVRLDKREIELEMMVRVPTAPKAQRFKDCFPKTSNFVMLSNHHLTMPTKKAPKTTLASQSKPELSAKFKKKKTELKVHSDSKSRSKEFKNAIHKDYVQIQPNPSVPNTSLHSKKPSLTKTVEDSKTSSTQKLSSSNHKSISLQSNSKAFIFVLQDNNLFLTSHQASSCTERLISTSAFRVLPYKKNKVLVVDAGIFLFDALSETKTRLLSQDEFKIEEIYGSAALILSLGRISNNVDKLFVVGGKDAKDGYIIDLKHCKIDLLPSCGGKPPSKAVYHNGCIYVFSNSNSVDVYSISSKEWKQPLTLNYNSEQRIAHAMILQNNLTILYEDGLIHQ